MDEAKVREAYELIQKAASILRKLGWGDTLGMLEEAQDSCAETAGAWGIDLY